MVWNRMENRVYYDSSDCFDTLHAMKSNSLRDNCMTINWVIMKQSLRVRCAHHYIC